MEHAAIDAVTYPQLMAIQLLPFRDRYVMFSATGSGVPPRNRAGKFMAAQPNEGATPLAALTDIERSVLEFIERAALQERELEPNEEIADALGFSGTGTVRGIVLRLERKGYVRVESYQRGRSITALRIGKSTKPPMCLVPHWRTIYEKSKRDTPTQPITTILQFPTIMSEINKLQRERNLPFAEAQVVLMAYGVSQLAMERCREQAHG